MAKLILRRDDELADDIAAENLFSGSLEVARAVSIRWLPRCRRPCSSSRSVQHPTSRRESAHARNSERRRAPSTS